MSLSRYKNLSEILSSTAPTRGKYFTDNQSKLLGPTTLYSKINVEKFLPLGSEQSKQKVEFHIYSRDGGYIASNPYTTNYQIIDETKILFTEFKPNNSNEIEKWMSFEEKNVETYNLIDYIWELQK
jgi:hypothetical protein